jgi:hypothetical protein
LETEVEVALPQVRDPMSLDAFVHESEDHDAYLSLPAEGNLQVLNDLVLDNVVLN